MLTRGLIPFQELRFWGVGLRGRQAGIIGHNTSHLSPGLPYASSLLYQMRLSPPLFYLSCSLESRGSCKMIPRILNELV